MDGSVAMQNSVRSGIFGVRTSDEKRSSLQNMQTEFEDKSAYVQRTRGEAAGVQVDLSPLCCTTCKTGFG